MSRAALALCLGLLVGQLACGPSERTVGMQQIHAVTPRERIAGAQTLGRIGKHEDDELWIALERLTRDPSVSVRIAAAESLAGAPVADDREPDERGALADDALSSCLSDLDETVRIAAAKVLGGRCNPRSIAYLHGAFSRSGPAVRAQVAASLGKCGVPIEEMLNHTEQTRRLHALEKLGSPIPAWRAAAAKELGMLGRPDDVAKIAPLLDDKDGAVAAAAAEGLALANATPEIPALQKMAGDEVPLIASAAIDALARFGAAALAGAEPQLKKQAASEDDVSVLAASALVAVAKPEALCAAALNAKVPAAGAMLARGCPIAPFAEALAAAVAPPGNAVRASVLLEDLAQAAPAPLGKTGAKALAKLCETSSGELQLRCAQVALQLHEVDAGPVLFAIASREFHALDGERARRVAQDQEKAETAKELAEAAQHAPVADQQKLSRLMALVKAHQVKTGVPPKVEASERLKQMLAAEPVDRTGNPLLAITLRAALGLGAKGAPELAAQLKDDRDPAVRAAALGEPLPVKPSPPPVAADCFSPPNPHAMARDAGPISADDAELERRRAEAQTLLVRAPSRAAKPGCLAAQLSLGPQASPPAGALEAARASLWSDDGQERADACTLLAQLHDNETATVRQSIAHDPERRVRDACTSR